MKATKLELKKLWMKSQLERHAGKQEEVLIHKWSLLTLEIGTILLLIIFLIKL